MRELQQTISCLQQQLVASQEECQCLRAQLQWWEQKPQQQQQLTGSERAARGQLQDLEASDRTQLLATIAKWKAQAWEEVSARRVAAEARAQAALQRKAMCPRFVSTQTERCIVMKDGAMVQSNDLSWPSWCTAISTVGWTEGRHYFEVTVHSMVGIAVGLTRCACEAYTGKEMLGCGPEGWAYCCFDGHAYHDNEQGVEYGARYYPDDTVGVLVDATEGSVAFFRNQECQGTAFTDLPRCALYAAVSLYSSSVSCRWDAPLPEWGMQARAQCTTSA